MPRFLLRHSMADIIGLFFGLVWFLGEILKAKTLNVFKYCISRKVVSVMVFYPLSF
jgi:hypothetical protein